VWAAHCVVTVLKPYACADAAVWSWIVTGKEARERCVPERASPEVAVHSPLPRALGSFTRSVRLLLTASGQPPAPAASRGLESVRMTGRNGAAFWAAPSREETPQGGMLVLANRAARRLVIARQIFVDVGRFHHRTELARSDVAPLACSSAITGATSAARASGRACMARLRRAILSVAARRQ
jgi:hypothetical protein